MAPRATLPVHGVVVVQLEQICIRFVVLESAIIRECLGSSTV